MRSILPGIQGLLEIVDHQQHGPSIGATVLRRRSLFARPFQQLTQGRAESAAIASARVSVLLYDGLDLSGVDKACERVQDRGRFVVAVEHDRNVAAHALGHAQGQARFALPPHSVHQDARVAALAEHLEDGLYLAPPAHELPRAGYRYFLVAWVEKRLLHILGVEASAGSQALRQHAPSGWPDEKPSQVPVPRALVCQQAALRTKQVQPRSRHRFSQLLVPRQALVKTRRELGGLAVPHGPAPAQHRRHAQSDHVQREGPRFRGLARGQTQQPRQAPAQLSRELVRVDRAASAFFILQHQAGLWVQHAVTGNVQHVHTRFHGLLRHAIREQGKRAAFLHLQVHADGRGGFQDGRLFFFVLQVHSRFARSRGHEHHRQAIARRLDRLAGFAEPPYRAIERVRVSGKMIVRMGQQLPGSAEEKLVRIVRVQRSRELDDQGRLRRFAHAFHPALVTVEPVEHFLAEFEQSFSRVQLLLGMAVGRGPFLEPFGRVRVEGPALVWHVPAAEVQPALLDPELGPLHGFSFRCGLASSRLGSANWMISALCALSARMDRPFLET